MATEARSGIIFGNEHAKRRTAVHGNLFDEGFAFWPIGGHEFLFDDLLLPLVGQGFAIAHQFLWSRHLHLCLITDFFPEAFIDEAGKRGGNKALETHALDIDHLLMLIDNFAQGSDLGIKKLFVLFASKLSSGAGFPLAKISSVSSATRCPVRCLLPIDASLISFWWPEITVRPARKNAASRSPVAMSHVVRGDTLQKSEKQPLLERLRTSDRDA